jgi:hypothetical protein
MAKKSKPQYKRRFDWSGFFLLCGIGLVLVAFGYFLFWGISTAPENAQPSEVLGFRPVMRAVKEIPYKTSEKIAFGLAWLFMFFGGFLVINAFYRGLVFILHGFRKS